MLYTWNSKNLEDEREVALNRLMLLHGVYEDLSISSDPTLAEVEKLALTHMMKSPQLFELLQPQVMPDFYHWPLEHRMEKVVLMLSNTSSCFPSDHRALVRFLHPDGRCHPEQLRLEIPHTGRTALQEFVRAYFLTEREAFCQAYESVDYSHDGDASAASDASDDEHPYQDFRPQIWDQIRLFIRHIISIMDVSDLSAPALEGGTLLVHGLAWWKHFPFGCGRERPSRTWLRWYLRFWLEDLLEAGIDLEAYGKAEVAEFRPSRMLLSWPPRLCGQRGSSKGPYKWKGFRYGPRPEDWDLIWELDPAVEKFVGDFWAWVEDPPLAMPGAWVDDSDSEDSEDDGHSLAALCGDDAFYNMLLL